ncbi:hypothetical protein VTI28DRAFT_7701 [Corynascus sepedonium]
MKRLVQYRHTAWQLGVILAITPKRRMPIHPGVPDSDFHLTPAPPQLRPAEAAELCQRLPVHATLPALQIPIQKARTSRQNLRSEASNMGVRAINNAFSTFDLLAQGTTPDGFLHVQYYSGV